MKPELLKCKFCQSKPRINKYSSNRDITAIVIGCCQEAIKDTDEKSAIEMWNLNNRAITMTEEINHPNHYTIGGIEAIEYMKAKSTEEEFLGFLKLTALKYLSRSGYKESALKDFKKCKWYLDRLIKEIEESNKKE